MQINDWFKGTYADLSNTYHEFAEKIAELSEILGRSSDEVIGRKFLRLLVTSSGQRKTLSAKNLAFLMRVTPNPVTIRKNGPCHQDPTRCWYKRKTRSPTWRL